MARKAISNDRYRLVGTYERLRKALLEHPDDGRLDKALSYPGAAHRPAPPHRIFDRNLRDLLPLLDELMSTPGVGHKKILGFFDLLKRASKGLRPDAPFGRGDAAKRAEAAADRFRRRPSCPESLWANCVRP
jgi:hypothetical protein